MDVLELVAECFAYPGPETVNGLRSQVEVLDRGSARSELAAFLEAVARLDLGAWEELHTRTLDLSPLFVPYVGHVIWGENYRRGEFMADLKGEQRRAGVETGGELPDHLAPVLRYLAATDRPLEDLVEVLPDAIDKMERTLRKAEPSNPYRHLLAAAGAAVSETLRTAQGAKA